MTIRIGAVAAERHTATLAGMIAGDKIKTSAFNREGDVLTLNEYFQKAEDDKPLADK